MGNNPDNTSVFEILPAGAFPDSAPKRWRMPVWEEPVCSMIRLRTFGQGVSSVQGKHYGISQ